MNWSTNVNRIFQAVRNEGKLLFDNIRNEKLKQNLLQAIPFWIASVATGIIAVAYAKLFLYAERGTLALYHYQKWFLFLLCPLCFIISWAVTKRWAPYAKGSGIPQVMASIELATPKQYGLVKKLLSLRIILVKIVSSLVMVLGGGIIGREGPTIQIAASVFQIIHTRLPRWWPKISKKNILVAGAASGLAAAFNTPLGGIVFAVEELSKTHFSYFKSALFTAVIIAGLTAQGLAGPYLYLGYPDLGNLGAAVFLGVSVVALFAGLSGSIMSKIILALLPRIASFTKTRQMIFFILGCAFVVSLSGFLFGEDAFGSGKELMTRTLFTNDKIVHWYTPFLRINGLIFSFIAGTSGGIFAPSLSAGASIGSAIAGWFHYNATNTNLLILSGMVAFLTGVTRSPFTSAILVLEMTDRHNVIFHLMLAALLANIFSALLDQHSIYEHLKVKYLHDVLQEALPTNTSTTQTMDEAIP